MMRKVVYSGAFTLLLFVTGCSDNNNADIATNEVSPRAFATLKMPANEVELQALLDGLPDKYAQVRERIINAPVDDWKHVITPLQTYLSDLTGTRAQVSYLIQRGGTSALRALAQEAYEPAKSFKDIRADLDVQSRVTAALSAYPPQTERQENIAQGLLRTFSAYSEDINIDQLDAINADLVPLSFAFYNNALSKSAVATFAPEDFSCLSDETKATLATDAMGNYLFSSDDRWFYWTIIESCVAEPIREKLYATFVSSAYLESQPLMNDILSLRYSYAIAAGKDTWASLRLTNRSLMEGSDQVSNFLNAVEDATDPAFQRLSDRYKHIQAAETGKVPDIVTAANRSRYNRALLEQTVGSAPSNIEHFEYHKTVSNLIKLAGNMFGLDFIRSTSAATPFDTNRVSELKVYDRKSGDPIGTLLLDPFYLEGASNSGRTFRIQPAMTLDNGQRQGPVIALCAGLGIDPSSENFFISPQKLTTIAHELGHALSLLVVDVPNLPIDDTLEVPSMFMQLAVQRPLFIKALLSDDTDYPLAELSQGFAEYWEYSQQPAKKIVGVRGGLARSALINELATWQPGDSIDLGLISRQAFERFYFPYPEDSHPSYDFTHIVDPGYDAMYYQYGLGEVIAHDLLTRFEASPQQIFDPDLGVLFRQQVLMRINTEPQDALRTFLGRDWNTEAFGRWADSMAAKL